MAMEELVVVRAPSASTTGLEVSSKSAFVSAEANPTSAILLGVVVHGFAFKQLEEFEGRGAIHKRSSLAGLKIKHAKAINLGSTELSASSKLNLNFMPRI